MNHEISIAELHLNANSTFNSIQDFFTYWEKQYKYKNEHRYTEYIGTRLTETSRRVLFEWKNGGKLSDKKSRSIEVNYPLIFPDNLEERYLNANKPGGAIWNIFYLHIANPRKFPIFDQHTYRSMNFMRSGKIKEIPKQKKKVYEIYQDEYIPFLQAFRSFDARHIDKALFSFGQYLKVVAKFGLHTLE